MLILDDLVVVERPGVRQTGERTMVSENIHSNNQGTEEGCICKDRVDVGDPLSRYLPTGEQVNLRSSRRCHTEATMSPSRCLGAIARR